MGETRVEGGGAAKAASDVEGVGRRRAVLAALVSVAFLLAAARGVTWMHRHDEGTTFDVAVCPVVNTEFLAAWPADPVPVVDLYARLSGRSEYSLRDTVGAVDDSFRTFHPPAYYVLVHLWTRIAGTGRLALRVPGWLLTAFTVVGVYLAGRRVLPGAGAALAAAALFALSPWVASTANYARPYHLALAVAVWSSVALLAALGPGRRARAFALFTALSLLGLYTVYHYAFVLAWQLALAGAAAWSAGRGQRARGLAAVAAASLAIAVGFAPWIRILRVHLHYSARAKNYFQGGVELSEWPARARDALVDFALADAVRGLGGDRLVAATAALGLATAPLAVWVLTGRPDAGSDRRARAFWVTASLLPGFVALSDAWRGSHTIFMTKLDFGLAFVLPLLAVRAWACLPVRALRLAGWGAWAALLGAASLLVSYSHTRMSDDPSRVAALLARADSERHLVVLDSDFRGFAVPLLLTLRDARVRRVRVTRVPGGLGELLADPATAERYDRVTFVASRARSLRQQLPVLAAAERSFTWAGPPWKRTYTRPPGSGPDPAGPDLWIVGPVRPRVQHGTQVARSRP